MSQDERVTIPFREIKETAYGLDFLKDAYQVISSCRFPAFMIEPYRGMSKEQLKLKYPYAFQYIENLIVLAQYIKTLGGGIEPLSYSYRSQHLDGMKKYLQISSKLNFVHNLNMMLEMYISENVGWGLFRIEPEWDNVDNKSVIKSIKMFIGDEELDLTQDRIPITAVGWDGKTLDGIYFTDTCKNHKHRVLDPETHEFVDEALPYNVSIRADETAAGSGRFAEYQNKIGREIVEMDAALQLSPFNFMLMRKTNAEDETLLQEYETPLFLGNYDYHPDIKFLEFDDCCGLVQEAKDKEQFFNAREFASQGLFRWGIANPQLWKRAKEIFDKVYAPESNDGTHNRYDEAIIGWASTQEGFDGGKGFDSGASIADIASSRSQGIYKLNAIVVAKELDDNGFLKFLPRKIVFLNYINIVRATTTVSRLNYTPLKVVVLKEDGEPDYVVDACEVFIVDRNSLEYQNVRLYAEGSFGTADPTDVVDTSLMENYDKYRNFIKQAK